MNKHTSIFGRGVSVIAIALAAAGVAPLASAQEAEEAGNDEIIVTGSRIGRTSFDAPTPVNVIGAERMQELALPSVGDALNQLPSFRALTTPSSILFRVSGAIAGRSLDLRGLGTSRTLVLVDGRRFVPSQDNGTVDLNGIPSALVKRAEVVTGGASAQYGADAVAGVVNLILDNDFDGFKTDVSYGMSGHNDAETFTASLTGGAGFANGRGHFIVGLEYQDEQGVGRCETRDYCTKYVNYVANPGFVASASLGQRSRNGLPSVLVLGDVVFVENPTGIVTGAIRTVGGVSTTLGQQVLNSGANLLPAALRGRQFSVDGQTLVPYQFGNYLSGLFMQGGDPSSHTELFGFGNVPLVTPNAHVSAMSHFDFDATDSIQLTGEFMYSHVEGGPVRSQALAQTPVGGATGININNPFISPTIRVQILAADPNITSILVNVAKPETGDQVVSSSTNDIWRAALGANGEIFDGWNWDLSYTHGETDSFTEVKNIRLRAIDGQAADAITPPASFTGTVFTTPLGAPVICRSSATSPADGCIPINFFGLNSISSAALAKYYQAEFQTRSIQQDAFSANLRGELFDLWAGPVKAATGVEFRRDVVEGIADPLTLQNAFTVAQVTALPRVKTEVTEGYVEASAPLLADLPFAKSLTIDGAYRWTHYSTSGNAETWKVGLVYEMDDQLLFRVTRSNDIRAPTAAELNPNTITTQLPLVDPFSGSTHPVLSITGGNPNLSVETAETETWGVVLKPDFLPNFRVSVDYYDINVDGGIDTLAAPTILQACFQQDRLCNLITFTGAAKASPALSVFGNFQNLSTLHAEGVELVADYTIENVVGGNLNFQFNANHVIDLRSIGATGLVTKLDDVTGNAGSLTNVQGVPSFKLDAVATYARETWSLTAHWRYIPEAILDPTKVGPEQEGYSVELVNGVTQNTVSDRSYLDLSGTIRPEATFLGGGKVELYGGISNVFDTYPPGELRFFGNPLHYDVVGRAFRLGLRTNW